jgi:hypothetical protein
MASGTFGATEQIVIDIYSSYMKMVNFLVIFRSFVCVHMNVDKFSESVVREISLTSRVTYSLEHIINDHAHKQTTHEVNILLISIKVSPDH